MNSLDLGHGITGRFYVWKSERDLNPQYEGIPDADPAGIIIKHIHDDGKVCEGGVPFETEATRAMVERGLDNPDRVWQVERLEPLTISPSILRKECGLHGFIQDGKWIPA